MPIHDQSYQHWNGTLKPHTFRWWVITKEGLKIILKRKLFIIFVMTPPFMYLIFRGGIIYFVSGLNFKIPFIPEINEKFFNDFFSSTIPVPWTFLFITMICVFGGSGLIANDLENNVLQLYLSKPLTRADYIIGKLMIIISLLGFVTVFPGVILFIESVLLSNSIVFLKEKYWILGSIFLYSFILTLIPGLIILTASSMTKNNRYAAIVFIAITMFTPIIYQILKNIFHTDKVAPISFWANLQQLGNILFRLRPDYSSHWSWSLLIVLAIIALCLWILYRRIKGAEIVK